MPSRKLVHVTAKVLHAHLTISATVLTLEHRPERLDTIGMGFAPAVTIHNSPVTDQAYNQEEHNYGALLRE